MRVVDVQPGPVGEDDVRHPHVVVGELAGIGGLAGQREPAGVAQRVLLLVVPPGVREAGLAGGVPVDDLGRDEHRVRVWVTRHGDAVLGLDAHDPLHAHHPSVGVGRVNHINPSGSVVADPAVMASFSSSA